MSQKTAKFNLHGFTYHWVLHLFTYRYLLRSVGTGTPNLTHIDPDLVRCHLIKKLIYRTDPEPNLNAALQF